MSLQDDRRGTRGQRVPFEALVVVANQKTGAGAYECEAVDVSEHGMHLRTAYLPDLGQPLTFRFDGGTGEIVAEGTVLWRDEQAKGGEFGVRFTTMAPECMNALREICGVTEEGEAESASAEKPSAQKGARVRLHIEGLGSPMRARVRDTQTGEVMVGSNLEFLKVGRSIDLEDVEGGSKRAAFIDKVEVEIDPQSKIPQLVVSLRYDEAPLTAKEGKAIAPKPKMEARAANGDAVASEAHEDDVGEAGPSLADRARGVADAMGPKLTAMGATLGGAFSSLVTRVRARREDDAEERPRRMTSPPPEGALHASGTKVVRGEKDEAMNEESMLEETDDAKMDAKRRRTRIAVASGLGFLVMLVVVLGLRSRGAAPPGEGTVATNDTAAAPALPAPRAIAPSGSGEAVAANIPLFGTTPLSTTEPAPMPLDPKMAQAPAAETPDPASDEPKNDKPGAMSFGKGKVVHAKTVKLKMDAPIGEIKGSVDGKTLTLSIPGRRNVEPASTLAKKDKRIASVKAVPKDGGVDVTVTFKDTPPPFLAKASGKLLELELGEAKASGGADDDATEAKTKKHKKSKAVAKKGDHKKKHKKSDD